MNKQLRTAGIVGIANVILLIPLVIFDLMADKFGGVAGLPAFYLILYIVLSILSTALTIVVLRGFVVIARKLKVRLLEIMSLTLMVFSVLFVFTDLMISLYISAESFLSLIFTFSMVFILGALSIPYGIGLLKLKKFGGIATAAGVLNIILGISFATILLAPLGALLIFPSAILEIIILFRASRTLK